MRAPIKSKSFNLHLTEEQHAQLKRRADAAGLSMHSYIVALAINGKLPKSIR